MTTNLILLLVAVSTLASLEFADGAGYMRLTFTFENHYTGDDREFSITKCVDMVVRWDVCRRKCYFDILVDLQRMFPEFSFTAKRDKAHGQLVTHVNGLKGPDGTFWAFFKRTPQGDCLSPLSVSNYAPLEGEHLVLSLQPYSIFNTMSWCPKLPGNKCSRKPLICCLCFGC
ncbi:hypothetical protein LSAT2_015023 [Lamellibrachia satsuma]|nr:hypothetical protein LSAT2_015023 [Lamellibrachia satsuma]